MHLLSINLNGSLAGFFESAKGVRQGEPLSPYLFVLFVEVLSQILNQVAATRKLKYHPKCKKLKHLAFADDLMVFTDGSLSSIQALRES